MGVTHSTPAMKTLGIFLLLAGLCLTCGAKPLLSVYYESLCPYCRDFLKKEVYPAYQTLADYFDVEFIAYGKAKTFGNQEDGFTFTCQHGPRECAGNIMQACSLHYVTDTLSQARLLSCMSAASRPELAGQECFAELGLDWAPVQECVDSSEGAEIHAKNGEITQALDPKLYGVPWPTWDGVGGKEVLDEMDRLGLVGYLCEYFYDNSLPGNVCD